jgi:hypothetical protein
MLMDDNSTAATVVCDAGSLDEKLCHLMKDTMDKHKGDDHGAEPECCKDPNGCANDDMQAKCKIIVDKLPSCCMSLEGCSSE